MGPHTGPSGPGVLAVQGRPPRLAVAVAVAEVEVEVEVEGAARPARRRVRPLSRSGWRCDPG
ncbi:hypothetical protein [Sphingomonas sp.]|uniref:hypothetical protein n=1 Tax=Sphingomonas sp. TaxID=28214 RepID=UPI0035B10264